MESWLTLIHASRLGPVTLQKLFSHYSTADAIVRASRSELQSLGVHKASIDNLHTPNEKALERDLAWLKYDDHHLITIQDRAYPELLKQIPDPPYVLYVHGSKHAVELLDDPQLGIVGSRNASAQGKEIATSFAEQLANNGIVITSGLASGIDGAAHLECIKRLHWKYDCRCSLRARSCLSSRTSSSRGTNFNAWFNRFRVPYRHLTNSWAFP